jgi:hypothetical protein
VWSWCCSAAAVNGFPGRDENLSYTHHFIFTSVLGSKIWRIWATTPPFSKTHQYPLIRSINVESVLLFYFSHLTLQLQEVHLQLTTCSHGRAIKPVLVHMSNSLLLFTLVFQKPLKWCVCYWYTTIWQILPSILEWKAQICILSKVFSLFKCITYGLSGGPCSRLQGWLSGVKFT